jgi:anti-anti-sigma regulatory factor
VFLVETQPRVRGLLEIARLNSIFILSATEEEALAK